MGICSSGLKKKDGILLTPKYANHRLQKQLVKAAYYGLPGTDGTWGSNCMAFLKNNHTILSVFYANPAHPFSRFERLIFLFVSLSFVFFFTTVFIGEPMTPTVASIVIAIMSYPFKAFARFAMECGCLYTGAFIADTDKKGGELVSKASSFVECFGSFAVCNLFVIAVVFLSLGFVFVEQKGGGDDFISIWLQSQLYSFVGTEILMEVVLHRLFMNGNKKAFEKKWESDFPADAPPKSLTDVGYRAMSSFLYDIDKYNDDEDKENLNSGVPALEIFETRFPEYRSCFMLQGVDVKPSKPWQPDGKEGEEMERGAAGDAGYKPVNVIEMSKPTKADAAMPPSAGSAGAAPPTAAAAGLSAWNGKYDAEGLMLGDGFAEFTDGSSYRGWMKHSKKSGKGKFRFPNNDMYEGEFVDNMRHGRGLLQDANGKKIFKGTWMNDGQSKSDFF